MMDMREFQEKLEQLMELAAKQEKNLNNEQILGDLWAESVISAAVAESV